MGMMDGRVVVITGAGRGIGAACAKLLAAEGASVVVNDLGVSVDGRHPDQVPAQSVVDEIIAVGGVAIADSGDVSNFDHAAALVETAIDNFGKLDVLINAAGNIRARMIFNMTEEEWDAVINVHLKGTFNTTRHASAYWRATRQERSRRLINFTSTAGLVGSAGQPNYSAAKLGIVGFTFSCAGALEKYGVTCNCVAPSAMTRMVETVPEERQPRAPELITPENVAPVVTYLASTRSDWCNGRVLGAAGLRVVLWANPQPLADISSPVPWDLGQLADAMEGTLRGDLRLRR